MNKFVDWVKRHKVHTVLIVLLLVAVIALSAAGAMGVFNRKNTDSKSGETKIATEVPKGTEKTPVEINIAADDKVTDSSTPVILHVKSTDERENPVDFYHAVDSGKKTAIIELSPGEYIITVTGVINKDGSVSKPETKSKKIVLSIKSTAKSGKTENKATVNVKLDKTYPADKVTADDVKEIAETTKNAVAKGDSSLKGDAGKSILDKVETNVKANKNISEEDKKAVEESTSSAVKATETKPALTVTAPPTSASNQESKPESKPKAKTGHYETRTKTVKVPRQVTEKVLVKAAWNERVFSHYIYHFEYDGFETTDINVCDQHGIRLAKQGVATNYTEIPQYKTVNHPAEYKTVTKTVYDEKKETYQVWVED